MSFNSLNMVQSRQRDTVSDSNKISYLFGILLIILLLCLYSTVYFIDNLLPTPLTEADEALYNDKFITERARNDLKGLTDLGSRVVGSVENEVLAVAYLQNKIKEIIGNANTVQNVEIDLQITSGSYYLAYKPYGSINVYANLQNIVVKIHSSNNSRSSVLINAHFDTVPRSPGGSDDGIHCAVMLEVLRKLSLSAARPKNNLIFLFNGGEESNIQASHGFITQHKWAHEVKVVVNLEATGAGGKELLFQAGPDEGWLMNYYSKVPHPHAQVAGEEIFKSGIIPSDSDYRIFRDFGGTVGYDFAYIKNAYRYHTQYDRFDNIKEGVFQHTGDNVLDLVRGLADAPEVEDPKRGNGGAVYYDFIGLFFISYDETLALIINVLTVAVSFGLAIWCLIQFEIELKWATLKYVGLCYVSILLGLILSAAFNVIVGLILGAAGRTMSWYRVPIISIGLYCVPVLVFCFVPFILLNKYYKMEKLAVGGQVLLQIHFLRLFWTTVIIVGISTGIKSVYVMVVPTIFNISALVITHVFDLYKSNKIWPVLCIASSILPSMFNMYIAHNIVSLFIPICGRFGAAVNPEFIIGLFLVGLTILATSYYIPLIGLLNRPTSILLFLSGFFLAAIFIIISPMGFPYSGDPDSPSPQRFPIFHTHRKFHNEAGDVIKEDAGFYFRRLDYNSPTSLEGHVSEIEKAVSLKEDCASYLFCGLPVIYSRDLEELETNIWIPADDPPIFPEQPSLILNSITKFGQNVLRYNFTMIGPSCMDLYLSPKPGMEFYDTNLNDYIPIEQPQWNGRQTLYTLYVYGKEPVPLDFYVDIVVPENWDKPALDIAITGKYIHDRVNVNTPEFQRFLNEFPDWTVFTMASLAYYESWIY